MYRNIISWVLHYQLQLEFLEIESRKTFNEGIVSVPTKVQIFILGRRKRRPGAVDQEPYDGGENTKMARNVGYSNERSNDEKRYSELLLILKSRFIHFNLPPYRFTIKEEATTLYEEYNIKKVMSFRSNSLRVVKNIQFLQEHFFL